MPALTANISNFMSNFDRIYFNVISKWGCTNESQVK